MDKSTKNIYLLLQSVFSLSDLLNNRVTQSVTLGTKTITYMPHEENEYFHLGMFIEQDHQDDMQIYNEITVRIWNNQKAEAYAIRQAHFGRYEETYIKRYGVEYARPSVRAEANQFLLEWLTSLQKEHGSLQLQ